MFQDAIDSAIQGLATLSHHLGTLLTKVQLSRAYERDQAIRNQMAQSISDDMIEKCTAIDAENTALIKSIIAQHGFPTLSQFGEKANNHAWALVQHADRDPEFQLDVLKKMHAHLSTGEVRIRDYALLFDRVAVNFNQPQFYGTQFDGAQPVSNPRPIIGLCAPDHIIDSRKDLAIVNARRHSVGLEPFEDYYKQMNAFNTAHNEHGTSLTPHAIGR